MRGQGSDCVRCTREISPPAGGDLLFPGRKRRQNATGDAADGLRLRFAPPRSIGLPPYPLWPFGPSPPDRGSRPPAILWFLSDRSERNSPPQRRNFCFVLGGCSACGRATFQRRKVTASSQSPLCSGHPGLGIPHAAPLLLLSNHEPLRWVHGWGPIAGLRARTRESRAVSLAFPAGAVPS